MLTDAVRDTLSSRHLIARNSRVLVGVSGGADSMALLSVLRALKNDFSWDLYVIHVNHQLRDAADSEAEFVSSYCREHGIPYYVEKVNVEERQRAVGMSLEEVARELRYAVFSEYADRLAIDYVALAHHADDQAETVLLRLLRWAGLKGLCAIPYSRALDNRNNRSAVSVVRPLLNVSKDSILAYLKETKQDYVEDESNVDVKYTRNRVRKELLPHLREQYNQNIDERLVLLAEQLQADYSLIDELTEKTWKRVARTQKGSVVFQTALFKKQSTALRRQLLRKAIETLKGDLNQIEFRHWQEVECLLKERPVGSVVDLPGKVSVELKPEYLRVFKRT